MFTKSITWLTEKIGGSKGRCITATRKAVGAIKARLQSEKQKYILKIAHAENFKTNTIQKSRLNQGLLKYQSGSTKMLLGAPADLKTTF